MEEALAIENGFKELHKGVYIWGAKVYTQSVDNGYIESADGWKLKLPEFTKFLSLKEKVEAITKTEWERYKQGKLEYLELKKNKDYNVKIWQNLELYKEKKKIVSAFFKLKSEYQRLALNNPVQSEGSHMTKRAMVLLFDWIVKNNLVWKVKICNVPHDEVVVECPINSKSLVEQAVERCMIKGGNYYLTNLKIKADAHSAKSWGQAKG
jgi:DNA polymerase I-like protein with 3'-5' exonuclease and polymerase domains